MRLRDAFELLDKELLDNLAAGAANSTFTSDTLDKITYNTCTVQIDVTAGTTATVKIEGSIDGTNWFSVPYRTPASDTSANTDLTLTSTAITQYFVDPKYARYIRVRCTANTGCTFNSVRAVAVF